MARISPPTVPTVKACSAALAAAAWCAAFGVFVVRYAPMLWRARADGRPG
jgi:uncharacterized protein involved in response to NO